MNPSARISQRPIALVVFWLVGIFVLFLLVEGLCSSLFVIHKFWTLSRRDEDISRSTRYDPELGWVNIPDLYRQNFYNPGVYVQTNSRGFRNKEEFTTEVPRDKVRVICYGDSFTWGPGVDNDHTWCAQLASLDRRVQSVNMGVPGYGVDQFYLMHQREGTRLVSDVLVFAIITDDFRRMQSSRFLGFRKPMLQVEGGKLTTTNVPIRKESGLLSWLHRNGSLFPELRSVVVLQGILDRVRTGGLSSANVPRDTTRNVLAKMIQSLQADSRRQGALLVMVYLPTLGEVIADKPNNAWQTLLRQESAAQGVLFLDLLEESRGLPVSDVIRMYIPRGSQRDLATAGHLTEYGNEYVSRRIYRALTSNPELSARLSRLP